MLNPAEWDSLECTEQEERALLQEMLKEMGYGGSYSWENPPNNFDEVRHAIRVEIRRRKREEAWDRVFAKDIPQFPAGWWTVKRGCAHNSPKSHCKACSWDFCPACAEDGGRCPRCRAKCG